MNPETPSALNQKRWVAWAIVLSAAAILAYHYIYQVDLPYQELRIKAHGEILEGHALSPYRYRVLVPAFLDPLIKAGAKSLPYMVSFFIVYALYEIAAIALIFGLLFAYLRNWFAPGHALVGVLFAALSAVVAFRDHFFQPWSLMEVVFVILGMNAIFRKKLLWLGVLVVLSTLNRETSLLLPLAFLFTGFTMAGESGKPAVPWKVLALSALFFALWLGTFLGLRAALGDAPPIHSMQELWEKNLGSWPKAVLNNVLFMGAFWLFAILGLRKSPPFCRRAALVVPFYLAAVFRWGFWYEVRLMMPLLPVLIPLGLSYLAGDGAPSARTPTAGRT